MSREIRDPLGLLIFKSLNISDWRLYIQLMWTFKTVHMLKENLQKLKQRDPWSWMWILQPDDGFGRSPKTDFWNDECFASTVSDG